MTAYTTYLKMQSVPAGAVLERILQQQGLSHKEIAPVVGISSQSLTRLVRGRQRFTPVLSSALEQALHIPIQGFFCLLQSNHDSYEEHLATQAKPDLSRLSCTTFWDSDISRIDWQAAAPWAIRRVLEYGNTEELKELSRFYGKTKIMDIAARKKEFRLYNHVQKQLVNL